ADGAQSPPTLIARSIRPQAIVVCAANERAGAPYLDAARMTGWRTRPAVIDGSDPLTLMKALLEPSVDTVLVGAGDPPGPDERRVLDQLAAVVTGAVARRPDLTIILAGGMADQLGRLEAAAQDDRRGEILLGPAATSGDSPGSALRELLDDVRDEPNDPLRTASRAPSALADVPDWRVELL